MLFSVQSTRQSFHTWRNKQRIKSNIKNVQEIDLLSIMVVVIKYSKNIQNTVSLKSN